MTYALGAGLILGAYLIGSIPFGLLIARAHGKNLRSIGSGNIGATNVSRAVGRKWGYICFGLDATKGLLPMLVAMFLIRTLSAQTNNTRAAHFGLWLAIGCAAILGHIFPIYLRFRGGKGVATSFGVALGLWPYFTLCAMIAIVVWTIVWFLWRYVSLASITGSAVFPIALGMAIVLLPNWQISDLWPLLLAAIAIPAIVILRHHQNIKRLIIGTERKGNKKR